MPCDNVHHVAGIAATNIRLPSPLKQRSPFLFSGIAMPTSSKDSEALNLVCSAFKDCIRPAHFTNHQHCEECEEHDQTLLSRTPDTIALEDVGNPGWDPISFISPEGFCYYLPGLARLAIEDTPSCPGLYTPQFFWHLILDGPCNERVKACTPEQRRAVAAFVQHIIDSRSELLDKECISDDAILAWKIWHGEIAAQPRSEGNAL